MRLGYQTLALLASMLLVSVLGPNAAVQAQQTAFTYQGFLEENDKPATGTFDFEFELYDGPDPFGGASQQGTTYRASGVQVTDGIFIVMPDFGPGLFDGRELWLRTCLREPPEPQLTCLEPLHQILPVPYATFALEAATLQGKTADDFVPRTSSCEICLGHADNNGTSPDREVCFDLASNGRDNLNRLQLPGNVDDNDRLWLWMECTE